MEEIKPIDRIERMSLVEICKTGNKKYDQAMPIDIPTGENSMIELHYCAIPEYNGCSLKSKKPIVIEGKEYYFCRRTK